MTLKDTLIASKLIGDNCGGGGLLIFSKSIFTIANAIRGCHERKTNFS